MSNNYDENIAKLAKDIREYTLDKATEFVWDHNLLKLENPTQYLMYYCKLQAVTNHPKRIRRVRARWEFVQNWGACMYAAFYSPLNKRLAWREVCDTLVWNSKCRAINANSVDAHLGLAELVSKIRSKRGSPEEKTIRSYISECEERGLYIVMDRETHAREKWVAMSVDGTIGGWTTALINYLINCKHIGQTSKLGEKMRNDSQQYWVDNLGMKPEIWNWAMKKDWKITQ